MAQPVVANVLDHPMDIRLFCPVAVLVLPEPEAQLVHQFYGLLGERAGDVIHDNSILSKMTVSQLPTSIFNGISTKFVKLPLTGSLSY